MNVILFLKSSLGELHVGLPLVYFLKKELGVNVFFASASNDALKKLRTPLRYDSLIKDLGKSYFGKEMLHKLLSKIREDNEATLILTCDSGCGPYEKKFRALLKKSRIVHFHHAYAFQGNPESKRVKLKKRSYTKPYLKGSEIFLSSEEDRAWYQACGFSPDKISLIGALGYKPQWLNLIDARSRHRETSSFSIFVPIRDSHPLYLTEKNFKYLIDYLERIIKFFPSCHFTIKLHPRQKEDIELKKKLSGYKNTSLSNETTFNLASESELTLSFWSSAIADSIACGTPTIEFHRHEINHSQLVNFNGELRSLYYINGMTKFYSNGEDVMEEINRLMVNPSVLLAELVSQQKKNFEALYSIDSCNSKLIDVATRLKIQCETQPSLNRERIDALLSLSKFAFFKVIEIFKKRFSVK